MVKKMMKKFAAMLVTILILFNLTLIYASAGEALSKAKNINSIEIDGNKVSSTSTSLVEIADYNSNITTSAFVLSGKSSEGVEISIYTKKDKKETFTQNKLVEKFTVGKSGYFAKKINVDEGTTYILVVAKKDSDVQLSMLKVVYQKEESFGRWIEKVISNIINSFGK